MTDAGDPLLPCPPWCTGDHSGQEEWKGDRFHESAPVELDLSRQPTGLYIEATLTQYPMSTRHQRRAVYAHMSVSEDSHGMQPEDLDTLADGLVAYAGQLRALAARLAEAQAADLAARSDRT